MRKSSDERYLIISDLQIPFHHEKSLIFCKRLQKEYRIPNDRIYCVGDELDQYWGGLWDKDPDMSHTANQEIEASREILRSWYAAFPEMSLCESNHGSRWKRKAFAAQIPAQLMRLYRDVIDAPRGWQWRKFWRVHTKNPFIVEHGDDWGGQYPHIAAAIHNGLSTVIGHHHSLAGTYHIKTNGYNIWGMVAGSLIDFEAYAFEYARNAKKKPQIGTSLVLDSGRQPLWIPLE